MIGSGMSNGELKRLKLENLEQLKLENKGVSAAYHNSFEVTETSTLFISLGGLANSAVNLLKGKAVHAYGEENCRRSVRFLALDVDETELFGRFQKKAGGNLEDDEVLSLYNPARMSILADGYEGAPSDVQAWLSKYCSSRIILINHGAQARRQIGRAMILDGMEYQRIRERIGAILSGMHTERLIVVIIASISGGMGGGSIIDFTYLLRDILEQTFAIMNYSIEGHILMPEVLFGSPAADNDPVLKSRHMKNSYATLKDIDYYCHLDSNGGAYSIQFDCHEINSTRNLFDSCTIVSSYREYGQIRYTKDQVLDALTDHLLMQISNSGEGAQLKMTELIEDIYCKRRVGLGDFFARFLKYPRAAYFDYNLIGHVKISTSYEEIMAYLAYGIYDEIYERWSQKDGFDEGCLYHHLGFVDRFNPDCMEKFARKILEETNPEMKLTIEYPDALWPNKGDYRMGCDDVKRNAERLGEELMHRLRDGNFRNKLVECLKQQIEEGLKLCFEQYGPFAAVEFLKTRQENRENGNTQFRGILEELVRLSQYVEYKANEMRRAMGDENFWESTEPMLRERISKRVLGTEKSILEHVESVCEQVAQYTIRAAFYQEIQRAIEDVIHFLEEENDSVWSVYAVEAERIHDILRRNYEYATSEEAHTRGNGRLSVNIINLYDRDEKTQKLKHYLDSFITQERVDHVAEQFLRSMEEDRAAWLGEGTQPATDLAKVVQKILDDSLFREAVYGPLPDEGHHNNGSCVEWAESLLMAAYAPQKLDYEGMKQIWENDPSTARNLISYVARGILDCVEWRILQDDHFLGHVNEAIGGFVQEDFRSVSLLCIPKEMPGLISAVRDEMYLRRGHRPFYDSFMLCEGRLGYEIGLSTLCLSIPLYALAGIDRCDREYRMATPVLDWHLHLDKNGWDLPNPYILDIAMCTDGEHYKEYREYWLQRKIAVQIQEAIKLGMIFRDVDPRGELNCYYSMYVIDYEQSPDMEEVEEKIKACGKTREACETKADVPELMGYCGYVMRKIKLVRDLVALNTLDVDLVDEKGEERIPDLAKIIFLSLKERKLLSTNLETWKAAKEKWDADKGEM